MGLLRDIKDGVVRDIRSDILKAKGIYKTDNYSMSCVFCQYWNPSQEGCAYHQLRFDGEDKRCNNFSHR